MLKLPAGHGLHPVPLTKAPGPQVAELPNIELMLADKALDREAVSELAAALPHSTEGVFIAVKSE